MEDEPKTRGEALAQAEEWARGHRSHWNEIQGACIDTPMIGLAPVFTRIVDTMEVQRLTTLATMLPES